LSCLIRLLMTRITLLW